MATAEQVLKEYFGYPAFRPGQQALVEAILTGRDALGIMPTGAGKSICYQVPALLLPGLTVVISPLISLMKDQVGALIQAGVPAACLNSSLSASEYAAVRDNTRQGRYKLLYIAPERLTEGFAAALAGRARVSMVTVDEAHCVSQWGQDFRPSYLKIAPFIESLPQRPIVSAFTATATREVREDIVRLLNLHEPGMVTTGFDRPNLHFEVRHPQGKMEELLRILRSRPQGCAIVYCATRKNVEKVCQSLCTHGYTATRYHAGLSDEERRSNQDAFLYDRKSVMVATNAFGMGIDKSNVSLVVHYNMPKNLESYYQEAGRAGRDGSPAACILLYSGKDVVTNQFLIENSAPDPSLPEAARAEIRQRDLDRLRDVTFYCACEGCLREYILRYFGESAPNFCGNCGNCNANFDTVDVTLEAQKIVSCVFRLAQRRRSFGKQMISDILRGVENDRIAQWGLSGLSTYGIMAGEKPARLRAVLDYLILHGFLALAGGEHPYVTLTERSDEIIRARKPVAMKLPRVQKSAKPAYGTQEPETFSASLYEALRTLRAALAKQAGVPPYVIFSNKTLQEMAARCPRTLGDFYEISGVGETKAQKYGAKFVAKINEYMKSAAQA